jgi:hypothetical protein
MTFYGPSNGKRIGSVGMTTMHLLLEGRAMRATLIVGGISLLAALTGCDIQQIAQPPAGTQQGPTNVGAASQLRQWLRV